MVYQHKTYLFCDWYVQGIVLKCEGTKLTKMVLLTGMEAIVKGFEFDSM